jgi:type 1 fimbria pilin
MNKLAIIAATALVIATAMVAVAQQSAFATDRDGGDRSVNQQGQCRNCQQQQAVDNEDSLNTEAEIEVDDGDNSGDAIANGGQFQSRQGGG